MFRIFYNKKERIIPICATLRNNLLSSFPKIVKLSSDDPARPAGGYVFTRIPGIKLNEDFVSKKFKKVIRAVGLSDKIHFHTLCHSFVSDDEYNSLLEKVTKENLSEDDIKKSIKNWKEDTYRV